MPSEADCYLMSLIENLARRHRSSIDLINAIVSLKERGYSAEQIAEKTNLGRTYVTGVVTLMRDGEERLVNAVDKGHIPLAVAIDIARSDDGQVQALLAEAYESGALRGDRLNIARKVVTRRKTFGKRFHGVIRRRDRPGSAQALIKAYEDEVRRQKLMIKRRAQRAAIAVHRQRAEDAAAGRELPHPAARRATRHLAEVPRRADQAAGSG